MNLDDPGWRLLERFANAPPEGGASVECLWLHSGSPRAVTPGVRAIPTIADLREAELAAEGWVGPRVPGDADPLGDRRFDRAACWPRAHLGKDFTLACFARAGLALREGGRLFVTARKAKGGKSLAAAMESLFGDVETIQRDRGYHLFVSERGIGFDEALAHEWADQRYAIEDPRLPGLSLHSAPGVFSRRELDEGTATLIDFAEQMVDEAPARVLDLCAGIGPLSLWAAQRFEGARVRGVESNLIAAGLAQQNAAAAGFGERVRIDARVGLEASPPGATASLVLSNPPTHAGEEGLRALLAPLAAHLEPGAPAYFVVNRHGRIVELLRALGARVRAWEGERFTIVGAKWS